MSRTSPFQRDDSDANPSVNALVYSTLKQWMLSGRLRPGNKLIPQELADAMEVSRTPIREALERLHQEGYAGRQPRRGFFVIEMAVSDVRDLYETREALELYALQQTLQAEVAPADIKALRKLNLRYAKMFGADHALTQERLQLDREFHLGLAALSGNPYLWRSLDAIFEKLIMKRRVDGPGPLASEAPFKEHAQVLDAIEAGDGKKATETLKRHIRGACERLLRYLRLGDLDRTAPLLAKRQRAAAPPLRTPRAG